MGASRDLSSAFSPPLELVTPRPRLLVPVIFLLHLCAAAPALFLELHWSLRLAWLGVIAVLFFRHQRRLAVRAVRLRADGSWELTLGEDRVEAELIAWFCQSWLCVLQFRSSRGERVVVLPGAGEAQRRRLRVRLRSRQAL